MEPGKIIPMEENLFAQGMPDFIGENYAVPSDSFLQTEIEYNGTRKIKQINEKYTHNSNGQTK